jgi:hypothetical protein
VSILNIGESQPKNSGGVSRQVEAPLLFENEYDLAITMIEAMRS